MATVQMKILYGEKFDHESRFQYSRNYLRLKCKPLEQFFVAAGFILADARAQILSHVISIFDTAE